MNHYPSRKTIEHLDVLIVGAGLSGISAAYHVQTRCPTRSYAILEGRGAMGGTWDLFRYPGVRSDSDMHTLGYRFRPWLGSKALADGPSILTYIRDTAAEHGIDDKIRFNHRVQRAEWSSADALWTVEVERGRADEPGNGVQSGVARFTCNFLYMCSGYYDYAKGHTPDWPDTERFAGRIIHPQQWPQDLDYGGKRIVVIGSGATAVTLVPALAEQASHVTMLQRSPTYVVARPAEDAFVNRLHRLLPAALVHHVARWKSILEGIYFYNLAQRLPGLTKRSIQRLVREALGPNFDVDTHFNPRYDPWDQRLCLVPDGDLFAAIKRGDASIATDHIERFTETGIRLQSGAELEADIVVTATGLSAKLMSGMTLVVDGHTVELGQTVAYRGAMYSDVPNLALAFGYTNASWTLKCELIAEYVCRLLNYMERHGYDQCTPRRQGLPVADEAAVTLTSGYIQRVRDSIPRQGAQKPWRVYQNYLLDLFNFRWSRLDDGAMEFQQREERRDAAHSSADELEQAYS